ncbi:MAG: hypothetical protein AB7V16_11315 [Vulcanibacillus sp.]
MAVIGSIIIFFISLSIVRSLRNFFMRLIGVNFMLVNPVTTVVLAIFLTIFIGSMFGL